MEHVIYEFPHLPHGTKTILERMRKNIAEGEQMGVTLIGNRLTVRFYNDANNEFLCQIHMVILDVEDGQPEIEEISK